MKSNEQALRAAILALGKNLYEIGQTDPRPFSTERTEEREFVDKILALTQATDRAVAELDARIDELQNFKNRNQYGFGRLALVVEYQDGTDSRVLPYRKHWNDCYRIFEVTIDTRIEELEAQRLALLSGDKTV